MDEQKELYKQWVNGEIDLKARKLKAYQQEGKGPWFELPPFEECPAERIPSTKDFEFAKKPKTFSIMGHEVPLPERIAPKKGSRYFVPALHRPELVVEMMWLGGEDDIMRLNARVIHPSHKNALIHATTLIVLCGGEVK